MTDSHLLGEMALRLGAALGLGAAVGLERGYHGRPAGFRTHALVCLASSALMLVPMYPGAWLQALPAWVHPSIDPTRLAQGIMTGIGFLGGGVIMKEGLSVRGLTTAASIWTTAGIGILVGSGAYGPAGLTTLLALGALAAFRWIERRIRSEFFAQLLVRFQADRALSEAEVGTLVGQHGFSLSEVTHHFRRPDMEMEYRMSLRGFDPESVARLSEALRRDAGVSEFWISPISH